MTKIFANILGALLLLLGILGFIPDVAPHGMLLKIFQVNHGLNFIHLFSGIAGLWCGLSSTLAARVYFRFFGLLYGLIAVMGLYARHGMLLGRITNNTADAWLHVAVAITFLILGLAPTREPAALPVI
jgi:Domain of unknown function (DUF4383)